VSEEDAEDIAVGDPVRLGDNATGTVSARGGAIDPATSKVAIKISVGENTSLTNGATVNVYFIKAVATTTQGPLVIPLMAVKMTGAGPVAFSVSSDKTLTAHPLTLGAVRGDSVEVVNGIDKQTMIVLDARGRKEGELVEVTI
jgi:hypothetical protein